MSRRKPVRRPAGPPRQQPRQPGRSGNPARRAATGPTAGASRPLPTGTSFFTPNASPLRRHIEQASAPVLVVFHRLPRPVFAILPLLLMVLGAFIPSVPLALVFLALAVLLLVWLAYLSWPRTHGGAKVMRLLVPLLVLAIAVLRISRG